MGRYCHIIDINVESVQKPKIDWILSRVHSQSQEHGIKIHPTKKSLILHVYIYMTADIHQGIHYSNCFFSLSKKNVVGTQQNPL